MSEKKEQVAALWVVTDDAGEKKRDRNGNVYFTGKDAVGRKVIAFYNTNKTNPKQPDISVLYQTERPEQPQPASNKAEFEDDIPF